MERVQFRKKGFDNPIVLVSMIGGVVLVALFDYVNIGYQHHY